METKAVCIEPNYPGTRLYEVGDAADLSEIDYKTRHCWEIGGVRLDQIKELDDQRFYLVRYESKDAEAVGKKMKEEIKVIENKAKTLEDENNELKLKLAKLEAASSPKEDKSKKVEEMIPKPKKEKKDGAPEGDGDIF